MNKKYYMGAYISVISWTASWIIFAIKLDTLTFIGFVLYGLGLSGLIIWIFVPQIIEIMIKEKYLKGGLQKQNE